MVEKELGLVDDEEEEPEAEREEEEDEDEIEEKEKILLSILVPKFILIFPKYIREPFLFCVSLLKLARNFCCAMDSVARMILGGWKKRYPSSHISNMPFFPSRGVEFISLFKNERMFLVPFEA
ncbi:hypothetical protein ACJX0J_015809 [Zea mays]